MNTPARDVCDPKILARESERESLCLRCGRCCVEKVEVNDVTFSTTRPCPYLDRESKLCTVYGRRFEANPHCLNVGRGIRHHVFPRDCPYVRDLADYVPPYPEPLSPQVVEMLYSGEIQSLEELYQAIREYPASVE